MAQPPKGGLVRGHDKPIHGSCAIYFPGGVDDVLISTAWISIWCDLIALSSLIAWLACCKKLTCLPAPQECIRTIWYNQNLASVTLYLSFTLRKWCFLFPPTAPKLQTHPCSSMECSHTMRFLDTGWVVQRQPGECSCWSVCEIRTSKPPNCRDLDRRWMPWKEAKRCSWSKSWWKMKWEFSDCLCLVVL